MAYNTCPGCGGRKASHARYCRPCSPFIMRGETHYAWKGDAAPATTKRQRIAAKSVPLTTCEVCGAKATDRHHRDGDPGNNTRANIQVLCRRCHMTVDGRINRRGEGGRFVAA